LQSRRTDRSEDTFAESAGPSLETGEDARGFDTSRPAPWGSLDVELDSFRGRRPLGREGLSIRSAPPRLLGAEQHGREFDGWRPAPWRGQDVEPEPRRLPNGPVQARSRNADVARSDEYVDPWPELPEERSTRWSEPWRAAQIEADRRRKLDLEQMGMPWNE
jgi:hypothetical protein